MSIPTITEILQWGEKRPPFEAISYDNGPTCFGTTILIDQREATVQELVLEANRMHTASLAQIALTREKQDRINELNLTIGRQREQIAWLEAQLEHKRPDGGRHKCTWVWIEQEYRCPCGAVRKMRF